MPFSLGEYFQKQGLRVVEGALRRVEGKSPSYVQQDDQYRQTVIQPAWEALPSPIRLLLRRRHEEWVALFLEVRPHIFDFSGGKISLQPKAEFWLTTALRKFAPLGKPDAPPVPGPGMTAGSAAPAIPRAEPVGKKAPAPALPPVPEAEEPAPAGEAEFQPEVVVGIDLGTTYSLIAYIDPQGRPCCLPNDHGELLTPSVVLFEDQGSIVGKEAVLGSATEPDRVAECVKRDMGAKVYRKKVKGEFLPPEVISSLILRSLKADAERRFGSTVTQAVITVPAYFEETRRRATMDAGKLAGLEVLDIINEPTAAALAYGYELGFLDKGGRLPGDRPLRVLVFDLGGGTFDVTIVEIQGTAFKALATDGDVSLGGKDWDERLVAHAADRFVQQVHEDPRDDPCSLQELWLSAEAAKRTLTERKKATIHVNHAGSRLKVEVTREEFEEVTQALLERTRMTTEIVVRQAGLTWPSIDRVLLVGGSTRMPMIRKMLQELSGKAPDTALSPDEAVAHGAALYAELLAPRPGTEAPAFSITNVNSHSLGVEGKNPQSGRKLNKILIPRNSPLPQSVSKIFMTFKPNQKSVEIKVLEGESDRPEVCTLIGTCAIRDLPEGLPAGWPIKIRYTYEANGRLQVSAKIKGHKKGVKAEFERENRLADEDVDMWTHFIDEELHDTTE